MDTMATLNTSYHSQYKQALQDPTRLSEEDLLGLLLKYPYSQPLVFAYERRKKLIKQESINKDLALLYANSEGWLMAYVNKPIESIEAIIDRSESSTSNDSKIFENEIVDFSIQDQQEFLVEEDESNAFVDIETHPENAVETHSKENSSEEEVSLGNLVEDQIVDKSASEEENIEEALELDRLVQDGGISGNYFVFDSFERKENEVTKEVASSVLSMDEKDDVSLYNDELMPYSFRWWLHKTRLEHAETYQPYVTSNFALTSSKPTINAGNIEESILDQQIKEHIIHFQDPEEKLSEEVKRKPLVSVAPKKGSEIIEKFIQKDPIIQPPSPENINNENMARQSAEDNYFLVTETLANIYIDQGLHLKAIEVFKKLILKYPEKKSYFATRIEELEKNS